MQLGENTQDKKLNEYEMNAEVLFFLIIKKKFSLTNELETHIWKGYLNRYFFAGNLHTKTNSTFKQHVLFRGKIVEVMANSFSPGRHEVTSVQIY